MGLSELLEFMNLKRRELEESVRAYAENLELQEVIDQIKLDPFYYVQRGLEDEQELNFNLFQGNYGVLASRSRLVFRSNGFPIVEIKRFEGKEVEKFYEEMYSKIQSVIDENAEDVPF